MSVVNAFSDMILGNPFSTGVGSLVEEATEDFVGAELWSLFSQVCKAINQTPTGPKNAVRAIRRRFVSSAGSNETIAMHCLLLLDTCMTNCGYRFFVVLANRDVLKDIVRFAYPDVAGVPTIVRDKLLALLQSWAHQYGNHVDLQEFKNIYAELRARGIDFPKLSPPTNTSRNTNTLSTDEQANSVQSLQAQCPPNPDQQLAPTTTQQDQTTNSDAMASSKLGADLAQVRVNVCVLSDLITVAESESSPDAETLELMTDISTALQEMSQRLICAISSWETFQESLPSRGASDSVLLDLINVNDEALTVLVRYDQLMRARDAPLLTDNLPSTTGPVSTPVHTDATTDVGSFVGDQADFENLSVNHAETADDNETVALLAPVESHTHLSPNDSKDAALIDF